MRHDGAFSFVAFIIPLITTGNAVLVVHELELPIVIKHGVVSVVQNIFIGLEHPSRILANVAEATILAMRYTY